MIKKKFTFWEKIIKNFSFTYIGNWKILYYYKNPRNHKITYGKIDLFGAKFRIFFTSFVTLAFISIIVINNFSATPAPATPTKNTFHSNTTSEADLDRIPFDGVITPENLKNFNQGSSQGENNTPKSSRLTKLQTIDDLKATSTFIAQRDNKDPKGNLSATMQKNASTPNAKSNDSDWKSQKKNGLGFLNRKSGDKAIFTKALGEVLDKESNEKYQRFAEKIKEELKKNKNLAKGDVLATSIEDFESITLKRAAMLSENTNYTPESDKDKVRIYNYTVKNGDSIGILARKFGVSPATIAGSSGRIYNIDEIWVGMRLSIPSRDGIIRKMGKGETLAMIANSYKIPIDKLIRVNRFEDPDYIPVASVIFLPDVKPKNIFSGFLWPVAGIVNSGYGWRWHPVLGGNHLHEGLDLKAKYVRVKASKSGKVVYAGWMGAYGKVVIIAHPGNFKTLYAHNSRLYVRVGQYVRQGQWISLSGTTGRSTGPHVHFEIWKNNHHVNPVRFLSKRRYF
jgi:LysM repeat protein